MEKDINFLKEQIVKLAEWEIYNNYLIQVLLLERLGKKDAKKISKECLKMAKDTFKEVKNESI